MEFEINGSTVETDKEGYLRDLSNWSEDLANTLAEREGLALEQSHWEVISFLRSGFEETGTVPNIRQMQKSFTKQFGKEKGNSKYLYGLFPYGPAKQACRIAGLPKPTGCV